MFQPLLAIIKMYGIFMANMEIVGRILVLFDQIDISLLEIQVEKNIINYLMILAKTNLPYTLLKIFKSFIVNILGTILFSNLLSPLPLQFVLLRVEVSSD